MGANKTLPSRSGLAIQSSAPISVSHRASPSHNIVHQTSSAHTLQQDDTFRHTHSVEHDHSHDHKQDGHQHQEVKLDYQGQGHNAFQQSAHFGHAHHDNHHSHNHDHHAHHDDHHHHDHHHGHAHHHDDHSHSHNHHGHGHHEHNHSHGHSFPQVYTQPLPSYASIFSSLTPSQKTLFTCFVGHFLTGIIVWWLGASRESLAIVGFSYLVLFDAFGVLNNFVSSVLYLNPSFSNSATKRPFGVKRFEVVFALANTIFLLFGTMYTTKESLEHLLLENHHSGDHHGKSSFPFGLLFMLLIAISASVTSSAGLRNHQNLVNLRSRSSHIQHEYPATDISAINGDLLPNLKKNIYSLSIVTSGIIVFLFNLFNITSPTLDKFLAFGESALMLYLGGTTAAALAKVLLQTMPDAIEPRVEHSIRQIQQNPDVISVDKVHFWQNSYGKCVGTAEIFAKHDANEDELIDFSYKILENLVPSGSELTISVVKK